MTYSYDLNGDGFFEVAGVPNATQLVTFGDNGTYLVRGRVQDKNGVLVVKMNEGVNQYGFLANRLIEQGFELTLFKEDEINLETAFMHLTKGITS